MPFKSKAQARLFFLKQERNELKPGTAQEWAHATPSIRALPEHVKKPVKAKKRKLTRAEPARSGRRR
jgi:hypothetical protein